MKLALGLVIIAATVIAILRRTDVRLALMLAAAALGAVSGNLPAVVRTFLATLSREQFVVPICTAMGFAHVLRLTQCDRHLVHLLVRAIRRVRAFLIPGAVLVGFFVNIPVISQTSTAVAVGPVLVPLLCASGLSSVTVGSALLLGASLGGELLNPGAPELRTVSTALGVPATDCVAHVAPLLLVQLGVATILFWVLSLRAEARLATAQSTLPSGPAGSPSEQEQEGDRFRVNPLKAAVPLLPLVLLFLTGGPYALLAVPHGWLVDPSNPAEERLFDGRLIGAAMLIGVVSAAVTSRGTMRDTARAFFEGAGYAFTHIISLIVTAACFGTGVELIGLDRVVGSVASVPSLLLPSAGGLPLAFAWLSGSGMAATQSLFRFFTEPSKSLGIDPLRAGAVVSIGAAAGRTMSPVAAVTLMSASLTGTSPLELARRVALPLLAGVTVVVIVAWALSAR